MFVAAVSPGVTEQHSVSADVFLNKNQQFLHRHVGPSSEDVKEMLFTLNSRVSNHHSPAKVM